MCATVCIPYACLPWSEAAGIRCTWWSYQANDYRHAAWWGLQGCCNKSRQGQVLHSQFWRQQSVLFSSPNNDTDTIWHLLIILWPSCRGSIRRWVVFKSSYTKKNWTECVAVEAVYSVSGEKTCLPVVGNQEGAFHRLCKHVYSTSCLVLIKSDLQRNWRWRGPRALWLVSILSGVCSKRWGWCENHVSSCTQCQVRTGVYMGYRGELTFLLSGRLVFLEKVAWRSSSLTLHYSSGRCYLALGSPCVCLGPMGKASHEFVRGETFLLAAQKNKVLSLQKVSRMLLSKMMSLNNGQ